jgi:hypothetical protein
LLLRSIWLALARLVGQVQGDVSGIERAGAQWFVSLDRWAGQTSRSRRG